MRPMMMPMIGCQRKGGKGRTWQKMMASLMKLRKGEEGDLDLWEVIVFKVPNKVLVMRSLRFPSVGESIDAMPQARTPLAGANGVGIKMNQTV